jgi:hypothetical protein
VRDKLGKTVKRSCTLFNLRLWVSSHLRQTPQTCPCSLIRCGCLPRSRISLCSTAAVLDRDFRETLKKPHSSHRLRRLPVPRLAMLSTKGLAALASALLCFVGATSANQLCSPGTYQKAGNCIHCPAGYFSSCKRLPRTSMQRTTTDYTLQLMARAPAPSARQAHTSLVRSLTRLFCLT